MYGQIGVKPPRKMFRCRMASTDIISERKFVFHLIKDINEFLQAGCWLKRNGLFIQISVSIAARHEARKRINYSSLAACDVLC